MKSATLAAAAMALAPLGALAGPAADGVATSKGFTTIATAGAASLEARLARVVKDDRCPTRVMCAWAGPAVIEVDLRSAGAVSRLTLSTDGRDGVRFPGWRIRLLDLTPEPLESEAFQKLKPIDAYGAALRAYPDGAR